MLYHQQFLGHPLPKPSLAVALEHSGGGGLCARAFSCLEMEGVSRESLSAWLCAILEPGLVNSILVNKAQPSEKLKLKKINLT